MKYLILLSGLFLISCGSQQDIQESIESLEQPQSEETTDQIITEEKKESKDNKKKDSEDDQQSTEEISIESQSIDSIADSEVIIEESDDIEIIEEIEIEPIDPCQYSYGLNASDLGYGGSHSYNLKECYENDIKVSAEYLIYNASDIQVEQRNISYYDNGLEKVKIIETDESIKTYKYNELGQLHDLEGPAYVKQFLQSVTGDTEQYYIDGTFYNSRNSWQQAIDAMS